MKKIIVSTTINPVTEAVEKFQDMEGWDLVMIGDKKTPKDYKLRRGLYVTPSMQEDIDKELSDAIGWNCIQRRNFGLVIAQQMNADIVALVDDDNIPYENWGKNLTLGKSIESNHYMTSLDAFDPIGAAGYSNLWHRGFPLQFLSSRDYSSRIRKKITPLVQADFWNGDPDIDAVCRMEHAPECNFDNKYFPISSNKIAPFNSQNTFISGKILRDYFLFPHIGRMDDIWAAFYVQAKGAPVIFSSASVYQKRNPHDLTKDMKNELLGYENNYKLIREVAEDPNAILKYLPEKSKVAFDIYQKHFSQAKVRKVA